MLNEVSRFLKSLFRVLSSLGNKKMLNLWVKNVGSKWNIVFGPVFPNGWVPSTASENPLCVSDMNKQLQHSLHVLIEQHVLT